MKKNAYFKNVADRLLNPIAAPKEGEKQNFASLKIMEYWVRILKQNPEAVNKEIALQMMNERYRLQVIQEVIEIFSPYIIKVKPRRRKLNLPKSEFDEELLDSFDDEDDSPGVEYDTKFCNRSLLSGISRYCRECNLGSQNIAMANLFRLIRSADGNDMAPFLYGRLQRCVSKNFRNYAIEMISCCDMSKDISFARMLKLREIYRMNESEMEVLIYLWLRDRPEMERDNDDGFGLRRHRFGQPQPSILQEIALVTGFSTSKVSDLLGSESTLKKLSLFNDEFDIPSEVANFLNGHSDAANIKAFSMAKPGTVPFEQLKAGNPDATLVLDMIKNHDHKHPLNILFYGVEGTGKTELAKAVAKEAGLPLWEVSIAAEDNDLGNRRFESRAQSLLQYRMRAAMLADWQCEKSPGIIMIDEADLVLNGCEKGSLNHFFESTHTPIIWITNSMRFVERSTCRRFDFSLSFKSLAKDERLNMLNSVLKQQGAVDLFTEEEKLRLVVEYPAMAGGFTIAAMRTRELVEKGVTNKPFVTMSRLLKAHTQLLGIENGSLREVESHAPRYSLSGLNIEGSVSEIMDVVRSFDGIWKGLSEEDGPRSLNLLLYGPPGTGKTEFVRHIARTLGRNLIVRRASDLLGMYVGQTEAQIAEAFEEAERTKSILFFDEADSFLQDRSGAHQNHEVSKVNEILTRMENFKGIFIAATNFEQTLDPASRRRFAMKLGFGYLKPEGVCEIWKAFFPNVECPQTAMRLSMLTPGDFNAVNGRLCYLPESVCTAERIEEELRKELSAKDARAGRTMGF